MSPRPSSRPAPTGSGVVVPPPRVSGHATDGPADRMPRPPSGVDPAAAKGGPVGHHSQPPGTGRRAVGRRARRRPTRRRRRIATFVVMALLVVPAVSFARAMTYPGQAPLTVRAVEWVRDHGGGGLVNTIETWWYTRHPPPRAGQPTDTVPRTGNAVPQTMRQGLPRLQLLDVPALAGEGSWQVSARTRGGTPALYTTWFRPDAGHTSVSVGVALIPQHADQIHLVGGTREPVPGLTWPQGFKVPAGDRSRLVAVFNAGFKIKDAHGGWYGDGKTAAALIHGAASMVIYRGGRAAIGTWGADLHLTPQVVAVRQNLALVVQHGRPVQGLDGNAHGRWGSSRSQFQYTWRSGIGLDVRGDLVYIAGRGLTLTTLAEAMSRAGIQTGMELDIHTSMVTFNLFDPSARSTSPTGVKLLQAMPAPVNRYLVPDQRDFFYVTAR